MNEKEKNSESKMDKSKDEPSLKVKKDVSETKPDEEDIGPKEDEPGSTLKSTDSEKKPGCQEELTPTNTSKTSENEQNPGEAKIGIDNKTNAVLSFYFPSSSSLYKITDKLKAEPKSNEGLLQKNTSVDSSGTGDSGSKSESPKATSDPSKKELGTNRKSTKSKTPSKSGLPSGDSSDTEENASDTTDSGLFSEKGKEIQNRKDSDPSTSNRSSRNNPESGLGSLPMTSPGIGPEDNSTSSKGSLVPQSDTITSSTVDEDPLVEEPNPAAPPGGNQENLPADTFEMDEISQSQPQPLPPPGGRPGDNLKPPPPVIIPAIRHADDEDEHACSPKKKVGWMIFAILFLSFLALEIYFLVSSGLKGRNKATFPNETLPNATFPNETLPNATWTNETLPNATWTNETFTNATFTNGAFTTATNHWMIPGLNSNDLP